MPRAPGDEVLRRLFAADPEGLDRLTQLELSGRVTSVEAGGERVVAVAGRKLHSGRGPTREADRFAERLDLEHASVLVLMGFGSGYIARALRRRSDAKLVVFEPDLEVLAEGLEHGEVPDDCLVCTTPDVLGETLAGLFVPGEHGQLVTWQPSVRLDPAAFDSAREALEQAIASPRAPAQTDIASSENRVLDDVGTAAGSEASIAAQTMTAKAVWNDHDDETYRRDQSHWRGVGRWRDDEAWREWGRNSLHKFNAIGDFVGLGARMWSQRWNILEWGPGGGAHLHALHGHARAYYGVDISSSNLGEAGRMIAEEGFFDFRPVLIHDDLDAVRQAVDEPIDLFLSSAVFQHFPSKRYGVEVLKTLAAVCRPGALGHIQIRFDNSNPLYAPIRSLDDYRARHITATSYGLDEFWDLCQNVGFEVLFISRVASSNNYATFNLRRRG